MLGIRICVVAGLAKIDFYQCFYVVCSGVSLAQRPPELRLLSGTEQPLAGVRLECEAAGIRQPPSESYQFAAEAVEARDIDQIA